MSQDPIRPGLLVLHGDRAELLGEAVFEWIAAHPLGALEEEVFLVQSNGVAEWLKMSLAAQAGICAATRVELPARFLWRAYRQVLGREAVPAQSPLDKLPLTWRLMQLLPALLEQRNYEPLAGFLHRGGLDRRLQLAQRLADLYDQYQVYRSDWLGAWAAGADHLPSTVPGGSPIPLPPGQAWQPGLWRELLTPLDDAARAAVRPQLHQRFLAALDAGKGGGHARLPRRVVLFGTTHVPMQTLQALAALSQQVQVLLAIPNPCRYHWADIIQGRELLRFERRRQPLRGGRDLAALDLDRMHAHAHPLLAAWGRQGRDFIRQLDAFDDALAAQQRFSLPRIDLFSEGRGVTLLEQVQAHIRDLVPLAEHPGEPVPPGDRSIVFHIAHSAQREVEILHDQLLQLLAAPPPAGKPPLRPRDIVVMVPDIAKFAPAVRSVFGQHAASDARRIPFDIADLRQRGNDPLLLAVEWLLELPQQRCRASELRDLLDVPAVARRFGFGPDELPRLARWLHGCGVRWGLDGGQRAALGLASCGEQNSLLFGLQRMLLGYASGDASPFDGITPYPEVGGLEASIAGSLADLVTALLTWCDQARSDATPAAWAARLRALVAAFVQPTDDAERLGVAAVGEAVSRWIDACDNAGFDEPVPLAVAREAVLEIVDEPAVGQRFRAGGVTFCTLLPMRSIPFEVVCLLGMNDGDYPRSSSRSDFDLMALPGQARPGDRSRRDDDRQLMLEALLSARRVLHVSWTGRSVRDNSAQPPSVLVSQLRDYIEAGWTGDVLGPRTTEHPLQPFSRRYFADTDDSTGAPALFTHAREWRTAHEPREEDVGQARQGAEADHRTGREGDSAWQAIVASAQSGDAAPVLGIAGLARFVRNPVKDFFRHRLAVVFPREQETTSDDETFVVAGLDQHRLLDALLKQVLDQLAVRRGTWAPDGAELERLLAAPLAQLRLSGSLAIGGVGERQAGVLRGMLLPMLGAWVELLADHPVERPKLRLQFSAGDAVLADWLAGVRAARDDPDATRWFELTPTRWLEKSESRKSSLRTDKLVRAWITSLLAAAGGEPIGGVLVGRDATLQLAPLEREAAARTLSDLLAVWRDGMAAPLPLPLRTGLALLGNRRPADVYEGAFAARGEIDDDPCLARVYPDYAALSDDPRFEPLVQRVHRPLLDWVTQHVQVHAHTRTLAEAAE